MQVDQKELDYDLGWAQSWYLTHQQFRSGAHKRNERKRLEAIIKHAKALKFLLSQDRNPGLPLEMQSPDTYLKQIISWADGRSAPKKTSKLDQEQGERLLDAIGVGRVSGPEWLAGEDSHAFSRSTSGGRQLSRDLDRKRQTLSTSGLL
jgi:hypothetical protein